MWSLADEMENWIKDILEEASGGVIEVRRSELANRFACAPSQVTYVLATRFVPERGYRVESRRGAGGYIRIVKLAECDRRSLLAARVGSHLNEHEALILLNHLHQAGLLGNESLRHLALVLASDSLGLGEPLAGEVRARVFHVLLANL